MRLAFGTGTGRCGTKSLRVLTLAQPRCFVTHERLHLPWSGGQALLPEALQLWQDAAAGPRPGEATWEAGVEVRGPWDEGEKIVGDIGPWYLPLVPALIERHGARVIHLERERSAYVDSALRCSWDCFSLHPDAGVAPASDVYLTCIPKFPGNRAEAAGHWGDLVHEMAQEWVREYPEGFRAWSMWDLDLRERQREMMQWLGVDDPVTLDRYPDRAENRLAKVGP